jgi:hydrogenase maturation protease
MGATIVIGVGNPYRRDDGAGIAAVRQLRLSLPVGASVAECAGDTTTLLNLWQGYSKVIIVDAMRSGRTAGVILRFDPLLQPLPANTRFSSTHAMGIDAMLALARALNRLPAKLVLYGIEGRDFGEGEGLSEEVAKAVQDVVRYILIDLRKDEEDA